MNKNKTSLEQEYFVAESNIHALLDDSEPEITATAISRVQHIWKQLKYNWVFWASISIILLFVIITIVPQLFTNVDPRYCILSKSLANPEWGHWFGFDRQGCDIFARIIYGTRTSILVGVLSTISATLIGCIFGSLAGFYGGILDVVLSRTIDIFFAIPAVLAAIVLMQIFKDSRSILLVVLVLSVFGWTSIARIMRGSVMVVKNYEFNLSAKAAGASSLSILLKHIYPNAIAPVIVYAMMALGAFIVAEATLSFLGLGLPSSFISWGADIAKAQVILRVKPMVLFYPSIALAMTVLSFVMLGDVIHDVFNPRNNN